MKMNPKLDKLSFHEAQKSPTSSAKWKCDLCEKLFTTETFLDNHLNRKHMNAIPQNATVCLADYCDIFKCQESTPSVCNPSHMEKRKISCESLASRCFPHDNPEAFSLRGLFLSHVCGYLTCQEYNPTPVDTIMGTTSFVSKVFFWIFGAFAVMGLITFSCVKLLSEDRVIRIPKGRTSWKARVNWLFSFVLSKRKTKGY